MLVITTTLFNGQQYGHRCFQVSNLNPKAILRTCMLKILLVQTVSAQGLSETEPEKRIQLLTCPLCGTRPERRRGGERWGQGSSLQWESPCFALTYTDRRHRSQKCFFSTWKFSKHVARRNLISWKRRTKEFIYVAPSYLPSPADSFPFWRADPSRPLGSHTDT